MTDPAALLAAAAALVLQTGVIFAAARAVLCDVAAGALDARLAIARSAFYGAALMPFAAAFPKQIAVEIGPDRAPVISARLPVASFPDAPAFVSAGAAAIALLLLLGAAARIAMTLGAVLAGERLARAAAATAASRFRRTAYADVAGPMVAGLFQPLVVLPHRLRDAPPSERRRVLRHEYAHLRQRDLGAALVQRLVEDIFWWNPFLRAIGRRLSELREMRSDEAAARGGRRGRRAFARILLKEADKGGRSAAGFSLAAAGGGAARRIERLLLAPKPFPRFAVLLLALAFVLAFLSTPRAPGAGETRISIASS